ncbi:MAG TPA: acylphosphatase [Anaerolineaceae bacterium]|nr:acylphosphatase [Anaerolineaceae bacterium]
MSANNKDFSRLHAVVMGHVQGVGFRFFVIEKADLLDVTGWVRNTTFGDVEVLAEGPRDTLEDLLYYLHKGPHGAVVTQVKSDWEIPTGEFSRFEVRQTA